MYFTAHMMNDCGTYHLLILSLLKGISMRLSLVFALAFGACGLVFNAGAEQSSAHKAHWSFHSGERSSENQYAGSGWIWAVFIRANNSIFMRPAGTR
jgi:hypothetical protein